MSQSRYRATARLLALAALSIAMAALAVPAHADLLPETAQWTVRAQTMPVSGDRFPAASLQVQTVTGNVLGCEPAGPDQVVEVRVATAATLVPAEIEAYVFAQPDCRGAVSPASNRVTITLYPPEAAVLLEDGP